MVWYVVRCLHHRSGSDTTRKYPLSIHSPPPLVSAFPCRYVNIQHESQPSPTDLTLIGVGVSYVDVVQKNLTMASIDDIGVDKHHGLISDLTLLMLEMV